MPRYSRRTLLLLVAAVLVLALTASTATTAEAAKDKVKKIFSEREVTLNCPTCLHRGYRYYCKVPPKDMQQCFVKAGEAHCTEHGCTCCRIEDMAGCRACDAADYAEKHYVDDEEFDKIQDEL